MSRDSDPHPFLDALRAHERERATDPRPSPAERYVLETVIGQGASSSVWRARDIELDRMVAVKVPRETLDADVAERFVREARLAAGLSHPNLVSIHDVIDVDGRPALVMELVEGRSLRDLWADAPHRRDAIRTIRDAARGIGAAHRRAVVHRDLKPANILVGEDGVVMVADFGIAFDLRTAPLTRSSAMVGTPRSMAPEQVRGERDRIGPATDVFALGCILYFGVTGRWPFEGGEYEVCANILEAEPRRPCVSRELDAVVMKCLEKDPARRYEDGNALADELERYLGGSPVLARTAGPGRRLLRLCRRHWRVGSIFVAVASGLIAWAVWGRDGGGLRDAERRAANRVESAYELLERSRPEEALAEAEAAHRIARHVPAPLVARGQALVALGDWPGAREAFEEAAARDPDALAVRAQLGRATLEEARLDWVLSDRGGAWPPDLPEARARLRHASSTDPLQVAVVRALLLETAGDGPGALESAKASLVLHGQRVGAAALWVVVLCCGSDADRAAACDAVLRRRPSHPVATLWKAKELVRAGKQPEATKLIRDLKARFPRLAAARDIGRVLAH